MNISGTWAGEYTYGNDYAHVAGKSVRFTLTLSQRGWMSILGRPHLTGFVRDNVPDGGQPERGSVTGERRGGEVRFVKSMPVRYIINDDGAMITLLEWAKENEYEAPTGMVPEDFGPQLIAYSGMIDDFGESMSGHWWLIHDPDQDPDASGTGTWSAKRASRSVTPP